MGQSLVKNYIHIVFSTHNREPFITSDIESELFSYIGGICLSKNCQPIKVGGYLNHVHILCMLSKDMTLAELLRDIKSNSSKWIKSKAAHCKNFSWQNGYGSFSVKPSEVDRVADYIAGQREHHTKRSFKEEYTDLLVSNKMDFDERYLWL